MTSLIVWVAADSRGPSSLNMATDSRLSWMSGHKWDEAKKVYASERQPFVFSFCGDSLFPTHALVKVVDQLNGGFLNDPAGVERVIRKLWSGYPEALRADFTIYIGFRQGSRMDSKFLLTQLSVRNASSGGAWSNKLIEVPTVSAVLKVDGSGRPTVEKYLNVWDLTPSKRTSRAYYSAFADAIASGNDPATGGAPQLGGLYRIGQGRSFGVVHEYAEARARRYFGGADLTGSESTLGVEWRNDLFERVDGENNRRLMYAQEHEPRRIDLRQ